MYAVSFRGHTDAMYMYVCCLIFRPGKSVFREKWLKDIIESKIQVYQEIDF